MKPGTRINIDLFLSFNYLGKSTLKLLVRGSRVVEQPIIATLVHLGQLVWEHFLMISRAP